MFVKDAPDDREITMVYIAAVNDVRTLWTTVRGDQKANISHGQATRIFYINSKPWIEIEL